MEEVEGTRVNLARSRLVTRRDGSHRHECAQWRKMGWVRVEREEVVWYLQRTCV